VPLASKNFTGGGGKKRGGERSLWTDRAAALEGEEQAWATGSRATLERGCRGKRVQFRAPQWMADNITNLRGWWRNLLRRRKSILLGLE